MSAACLPAQRSTAHAARSVSHQPDRAPPARVRSPAVFLARLLIAAMLPGYFIGKMRAAGMMGPDGQPSAIGATLSWPPEAGAYFINIATNKLLARSTKCAAAASRGATFRQAWHAGAARPAGPRPAPRLASASCQRPWPVCLPDPATRPLTPCPSCVRMCRWRTVLALIRDLGRHFDRINTATAMHRLGKLVRDAKASCRARHLGSLWLAGKRRARLRAPPWLPYTDPAVGCPLRRRTARRGCPKRCCRATSTTRSWRARWRCPTGSRAGWPTSCGAWRVSPGRGRQGAAELSSVEQGRDGTGLGRDKVEIGRGGAAPGFAMLANFGRQGSAAAARRCPGYGRVLLPTSLPP